MKTLYIYDEDTMTVVAEITAETETQCEAYAAENYSAYINTYSPAFGFANGLKRDGNEEEITLHNITDVANGWMGEQNSSIEELREGFRANASHLSDCFTDTADWAKGETFTAAELETEIVRIAMDGQEW